MFLVLRIYTVWSLEHRNIVTEFSKFYFRLQVIYVRTAL